jgi:1,4-dihydroxy-2-naphthoate octaprenyltransferase
MPSKQNAKTNSWQGWWLAIRPKTLPAAATGVVTGSALAWRDGAFHWGPALAIA